VVGTNDANRPIPAMTVEIVDRPEHQNLTPFEAGSLARLDLASPMCPGTQSSGLPRSLRVRFSVAAPGSYTIQAARLIYVDPTLDDAFEPSNGGTT
jgi:hypothetical protein